MKRLCAAMLLLLCLSVCVRADEPLTARGVVVDIDGKPISGVKVYAVLSWFDPGPARSVTHSKVEATTVAGKDGSFAFASLPSPKSSRGYCFVVHVPGEWLGWVAPEGRFQAAGWSMGPAPASLRLVVCRTESQSGRITDASGVGVAGVRVRPTNTPVSKGPDGISLSSIASVVRLESAVTDKNGNYTLRGIPKGARVIAVLSGPGWASRSNVEMQDRPVVAPGSGVYGRVVDDSGKGIVGVEVSLSAGTYYNSTKTWANGVFAFQGVPIGEYSILAQYVGLAVRRVPDVKVVAGCAARADDIVATKGVTVSGVAIDAGNGQPLDGVMISAGGGQGRSPWGSVSAATGADGRFSLAALPGEAVMAVVGYKREYTPEQKSVKVSIPDSGLTDVQMRLTKLPVCSGAVVDIHGKPVVGARVSLYQDEYRGGAVGSTDAKGRFAFPYRKSEQPGGG